MANDHHPPHRPVRAFPRKAVVTLASAALAIGLPLASSAPAEASSTSVALWAMSSKGNSIRLSKTIVRTGGLVHSEGGIAIRKGSGKLTGGAEYGSTLTRKATKIKIKPAAVKITPGLGHPVMPVIADYRPGGAAAVAAASYTAVDPMHCVNGFWTPDRRATFSGVVYVPCGISLTRGKQRSFDGTFVAEGRILVHNVNLKLGPTTGGPALISGASGKDAILITRARLTTRGKVFAPAGNVRIVNAATTLTCGVQAQAIAARQSTVKIPMPSRCAD
jgi:hypothetical protein